MNIPLKGTFAHTTLLRLRPVLIARPRSLQWPESDAVKGEVVVPAAPGFHLPKLPVAGRRHKKISRTRGRSDKLPVFGSFHRHAGCELQPGRPASVVFRVP